MSEHPKIDLRQMFQVPVRNIVVADEDDGISTIIEEEKKNNECPMVYQTVLLKKVMGPRQTDEGEAVGLDYSEGFDLLAPDTEFEDSILKDLFYDPNEPDKCELFVVVAMYNEGVEHFKNTMCGIANNLKTFVRYGIHPKRIGAVLIIDGVKPFYSTITGPGNDYNRTFFNQFWDEDTINKRYNVDHPMKCTIPNEQEHDEWAHIFMQNICMDDDKMFPLQFFFCIKQKNKRKLNTHLWFFGGFCEMIQPKYVMLVDVGTKPLKNSLFYMYEAMKVNDNLAGCCGEIKPMNPNMWKLVVPAQEVEYKFSHIFDKALESVIGYITVLPGAFSAYKWEALQGTPLWVDYFKSICHPEEMGPFMSNIYLAEDRVLCLSLVSKKGAKYTLRYVRTSVAETDVPESIAELMSQRRRWINGSWFALVDSLKNFSKIHKSAHSFCRRFWFVFQMVYYYLTVVFSWFMVGMFFLVFSVTIDNEFGQRLSDLGTWIMLVYVSLLAITFILALAVKPKLVNDLYKGIAVIFGLYMLLGFYLTFIYVFQDIGSADESDWARWAMLTTFLIFISNIVANNCVTIIGRGLFHFLYMIPTYVNIFLIYAICNTHDCSWGNRPDVMTAEELARIEEFEEFRARWAIIWVLSNGGFGFLLKALSNESETDDAWYVYIIAIVGLGILSLRAFGGYLYVIQERKCRKHLPKDPNNDMYNQFENANKAGKADKKPGTAASNRTTNSRKQTARPTATVVPMSFETKGLDSPGESNESFDLSGINDNSDENIGVEGEGDIIEDSPENEEMSVLVSDSKLDSQGDLEVDDDDEDFDEEDLDDEEAEDEEGDEEEEDDEEGDEEDEDEDEEDEEADEQAEAEAEEEEEEEKSENSVDKDMDYGVMIKYAKEDLNMSNSLLAEEMDIDPDRLRQIEEGEIEPEPDEADRLLEVLNKF